MLSETSLPRSQATKPSLDVVEEGNTGLVQWEVGVSVSPENEFFLLVTVPRSPPQHNLQPGLRE